MTTIRTRPPTGRVPWPLILLEGGEKAGKSWAAAVLSGSEKVGQTYWIDLGEGAADEYGAIPGTRYLVVEHDGTWASILAQVREIRDEAARAAQAGEPPVVLVVDSMTAEWELLKEWTNNRAAQSNSNKALLARDPNAELNVPVNLWNDANARHRRLMTILMTFPGIAVITAKGKEVVSLDDSGRPINGVREYKVEGHKNLAYDSTVWVRLSRTAPARIIGARSVHAGIRHGRDEPVELPEDWTLDGLIFGALKCGTDSHARQVTHLQAGSDPLDIDDMSDEGRELLQLVEDAARTEDLQKAWRATAAALKAEQISQMEADYIAARMKTLADELAKAGEAA